MNESASTQLPPSARPSGPAPLWPVLAAALSFYAIFIGRTAFVLDGRLTFTAFDDAMVSMTYARNLARGSGLVWNAGGEPIEGFSNPLWTFLMTVPHWLGLPDRLTSLFLVVIGAGILVGCLVLARLLVLRIAPDRPAAATGAAWLVAFCYPLLYWTLRGMEVGLITLLTLAGVHLTLRVASPANARRDAWMLGAVAVAAVWTRLDAALFVVVFCGFLAWQMHGRARVRALALVGGVSVTAIVLQELWRHAVYGRWSPNTYALKLEHVDFLERIERGGLGLWSVALVSMTAPIICAVAAMPARRHPALVLLAGIAVAGSAYSVFVGGDAWEWMNYANRFLVPGLVILCCSAAIGACDLAPQLAKSGSVRWWIAGLLVAGTIAVSLDLLPHGHNLAPPGSPGTSALALAAVPAAIVALLARRVPPAALTTALLCALGLQVSGPAIFYWTRHNGVHVEDEQIFARYGRALRDVTTDGASIAVVVAGNPIYFSDRTGVDLLGKSDRRIAELPTRPEVGFFPGHSKWDYSISILGDRPDVLAQLPRPGDAERAAIEQAGYVAVRLARVLGDRYDVNPRLWVREDSPHIRWDLLVRAQHSEDPTQGDRQVRQSDRSQGYQLTRPRK